MVEPNHDNRQAIVWRGIFMPGHEYCSVYEREGRNFLEGVAAFVFEGEACRLEYVIECDDAWRTRSTRVSGAVGAKAIGIELSVTPDHQWLYNGVAQPGVSGCIDVDLNFSPSTNLLPIRRLNLEVGQEAPVSAAWLRFPSFKLERFDQVYSRLDETTYRYASNGGKFVAELQVNAFGLVTNYPELWEQELGQPQGST